MSRALWWVDSELRAVDDKALANFSPDPSSADSCYSTALVRNGEARWSERHLRRLERDAGRIGLGEPSRNELLKALREVALANFGSGQGIVRLQLLRRDGSSPLLVGIPRELGAERAFWTARVARFPHDGPTQARGAKLASRDLFARAHVIADEEGVDEVLLVDAEGYLIEGSRSNLVLVDSAGTLTVPDLHRGGVAGIAREILCERLPELKVRDVRAHELRDARELIATNAVRGACPILQLDGRAVDEGLPGPTARLLADLLHSA